jgi:murein L,D-transpeptidase YafK
MRGFQRLFLISTVCLTLAACNDPLASVANKVEHPLPTKVVNRMKAYDMSARSPIMMRIFKEESVLEVWKAQGTGRYQKIAEYEICKWSGNLGPKHAEGDRQAPEGFYTVAPHQMNPNSSYYLSFNLGYPNAYDRSHGRTGSNLMVHGACSSAGCYSMTDGQVLEIYAFAREAFRGGQQAFQVQALPFRMTAENMARHRDNENYEFWKMLKVGYDHFELTRTPPKVDVCEKQYVFNRQAEEGQAFRAAEACPTTTTPDGLTVAYDSYVQKYEEAYRAAIAKQDQQASGPSRATGLTGFLGGARTTSPAQSAIVQSAPVQASTTPVAPSAAAALETTVQPVEPAAVPIPVVSPAASPAAIPADAQAVGEAVPVPAASQPVALAPAPEPAQMAAATQAAAPASDRPFWNLWSRP